MTTLDLRITAVSDFAQCHRAVRDVIERSSPAFLGRIGGSDTDVVIAFADMLRQKGRAAAEAEILPRFGLVKRFNGYYDKQNDDRKIAVFCELMTSLYQECSALLVCGSALLTEFLPSTIHQQFHVDNAEVRESQHYYVDQIGAAVGNLTLYPYSYVERILHGQYTIFNLFAEVLRGKKVAVVTPFAQSIEANWDRRGEFFPNYKYPEFEMVTYNTPITYSGLPEDYYPDIDWFATVERMKSEIGQMDFDLALLSCGSYAMPLGSHIARTMGKKAIYMGGVLQLFFGVMGRRYDNPFFINQINLDAFIYPLERERFLKHMSVGPQTAREAFGAYF